MVRGQSLFNPSAFFSSSLLPSLSSHLLMVQVNLPQRILQRCGSVLANEAHPLHQALERTFERLSYQSLTPSDFRLPITPHCYVLRFQVTNNPTFLLFLVHCCQRTNEHWFLVCALVVSVGCLFCSVDVP